MNLLTHPLARGIVAVLIVGAALFLGIWKGDWEHAIMLLGLAGLTHLGTGAMASRSRARGRMTPPPTAPPAVLVLFCLIPFLSGCRSADCISATNVNEAFVRVMNRHDYYVISDETLTPEQRESYLRTTQGIRLMLETAINPETETEQ